MSALRWLLATVDGVDVGLGLVALGVGLAVSWPSACIVAGALILLMSLGFMPTRRGR